MITASGVPANFGGVPLAFLFIVTLSTPGIVTGRTKNVTGVAIPHHGSPCTTGFRWFFAYMYFEIPLMVLVIRPPWTGLRPAWREAAENMGAWTWHYWRNVGGPVLLPSFLGRLLLRFGSALLRIRHA